MTRPTQARERTAIAWGRTALGAGGLAVLLIRLGIGRSSWVELVAGVVALATSMAFGYRGHLAWRVGRVTETVVTNQLLTAAVCTVGVLAIVGAVG